MLIRGVVMPVMCVCITDCLCFNGPGAPSWAGAEVLTVHSLLLDLVTPF